MTFNTVVFLEHDCWVGNSLAGSNLQHRVVRKHCPTFPWFGGPDDAVAFDRWHHLHVVLEGVKDAGLFVESAR